MTDAKGRLAAGPFFIRNRVKLNSSPQSDMPPRGASDALQFITVASQGRVEASLLPYSRSCRRNSHHLAR
jgi:hypothetical protein